MVTVAILRHAPPLGQGRLAGRRDIQADCADDAAMARMRRRIAALLGPSPALLSSPARRCLQTAAALGLGQPPCLPELWEQDYGAWEGQAYGELPDLGPLPVAELALYRPEGGESFEDMARRVRPVLAGLDRDTLVVGHAGTVRAALSMVVGPAALSFSVAPLSLTVLRRWGTGGADANWAIEAVNLTLAP